MSAGEASDGSKEVYVLLRYVVLAGDGMRFLYVLTLKML